LKVQSLFSGISSNIAVIPLHLPPSFSVFYALPGGTDGRALLNHPAVHARIDHTSYDAPQAVFFAYCSAGTARHLEIVRGHGQQTTRVTANKLYTAPG